MYRFSALSQALLLLTKLACVPMMAVDEVSRFAMLPGFLTVLGWGGLDVTCFRMTLLGWL